MLHTLRIYWPIVIVFAVCILVFALDTVLTGQGNDSMIRFVMVPADVNAAWQALLADGFHAGLLKALGTLLSYAFLHANAEHIVMNLVFIWVFGSLVLRELGALWFFIIFVVTAITGGIGHTLVDPNSMIPTLGASGALLGLEGVYFAMAMRWRLPNPDVWPISHPIAQERLMAFASLGIFLDISGLLNNDCGIAFGAHIGGFVGGFILGTTVIPRAKQAAY